MAMLASVDIINVTPFLRSVETAWKTNYRFCTYAKLAAQLFGKSHLVQLMLGFKLAPFCVKSKYFLN